MNKQLYDLLKSEAEADKCQALLTFELISKHPSGIGDHSTSDFWDNATQALKLLASADERLETLEKYFTRNGGCSNDSGRIGHDLRDTLP